MENFRLQNTPLFKTRYFGLLPRKLVFNMKVRVRLPGRLRIRQEKDTFSLLFAFSRLWNTGKLCGAETINILCTFVNTSADNGQQTTGPLHIGTTRPETVPDSGQRWAVSLLVRTTFPTPAPATYLSVVKAGKKLETIKTT